MPTYTKPMWEKSELKPGRELDALIAEKVIGLASVSSVDGHYAKPNDFKTAYERVGIPAYSTEILVIIPL